MPLTESIDRQTALQEDFLPLQGTDYIEFYVGNAKQAAHLTKRHSGFKAWRMPDQKRV